MISTLRDLHAWSRAAATPGYQSLTIYLPPQRAALVVLVNSDTLYRGTMS